MSEAAAVLPACPACGELRSVEQARIAIDRQHAVYFSDNAALQQQLTSDLEANGVSDGYRLRRCTGCGLTFSEPMTAPTSTWYDHAYREWCIKPEDRWEYHFLTGRLAAGDRVFEIGCGRGAFLNVCKANQIAASGIDFSRDAVELCRLQGLDAELAGVGMTRRVAVPARATAVVSFHVLEHLERPAELFRVASAAAAEGAALWVSVPSAARASRVLALREPLDEPPHHLTQWTEEALRALGAQNGWALDEVFFEPFAWRAALYTFATSSRAYRALMGSGVFQRGPFERAVRLALYPVAGLRSLLTGQVARMTGFSMIARFRRVGYGC